MQNENAAILAMMMHQGTGRVTINEVLISAAATGLNIGEVSGATNAARSAMAPYGAAYAAEIIARSCANHYAKAQDLLAAAERRGYSAIARGSDAYPTALAGHLGSSAPPLLFAAGNIGLLRMPAAAVVGARKVHHHGARLAAQCARLFAEAHVPVVSGGAHGVDSIAHTAALKASGNTVVILPQGALTYRPPGKLRKAIKKGTAAIVSEFNPATPWAAHAAVTRNATISALASVVCVIEPKKTGGSIRTAKLALEQGKHVFIYCTSRAKPTAQELTAMGAHMLVDERGRLASARLMASWRTPLAQPPGQLTLA